MVPLFVGCDSYESDVRRLKKMGTVSCLSGLEIQVRHRSQDNCFVITIMHSIRGNLTLPSTCMFSYLRDRAE